MRKQSISARLTPLVAAGLSWWFSGLLHAQSDSLLARPDFQNWLFDPAASIPGVPTLQQAPAVTLVGGGVWATGGAGTPSDGGIELVQAIIGQPVAPAAFWYLAPAPLPAQSRFRDERLTVYSAVDGLGRYRNHYAPSTDQSEAEHAVYLKGLGISGLTLELLNGDSGALIRTGQPLLGNPSEVLLLIPNLNSQPHLVRAGAPAGGQTGRYEIALYPVLRPGAGGLRNSLASGDRFTTNRTGAVGFGRWYYDEYLLQGQRTGENISVRVEAEVEPFIEVRLVGDDLAPQSVHRFAEGATLDFDVGGTALGPRDYLLRVSSRDSGALGDYRVAVSRTPRITGFSPESGVPGTLVTVRGLHFLEATENGGTNIMVTGVLFGGVPGGSFEPISANGGDEFRAEVPGNAVSGPITVLTEVVNATSAQTFVVLAPIGSIQRETEGRFSFGISNAVAGILNIVEATGDLGPPIQWQRVATNQVTVPGVWRYLTPVAQSLPQRFYRVVRE